jgi:hypothetical protein
MFYIYNFDTHRWLHQDWTPGEYLWTSNSLFAACFDSEQEARASEANGSILQVIL